MSDVPPHPPSGAADPSSVDPEERAIRRFMSQLYGAVAAIVRHDSEGAELLFADMEHDATDSLAEMSVIVAFATMDRFAEAFGDQSLREGPADRSLAHAILTTAVDYRIAPPRAVHVAAWRLEAARFLDDREVVDLDWHIAAGAGAERDVLRGSVALLAATVELGADLAGEDVTARTQQLCLDAVTAPIM